MLPNTAQKLSPDADVTFMAWQASTNLLSLGIRARAGHKRQALEDMAAKGAAAIFASI